MELLNTKSIGCIDYGNNNFFEVMVDLNGSVVLCSHDDGCSDENSDGTYDSEGMSIPEFVSSIKDRPDVNEILTDLFQLFL